MSLATPTAQELIEKAYNMIGVDNPETSDLNIGLDALNDLMDRWNLVRRIVRTAASESFALTSTQRLYTIGSGGDFNTVRPISIEAAFIRAFGTSNDTPVEIFTREEDNVDPDKTVTGIATKLWYLKDNPLGSINLNLTPTAADILFLDSWKPSLSDVASLATTLDLGPGFRSAIRYNLAVQLADNTTQTISDGIRERARNAELALQLAADDRNLRRKDIRLEEERNPKQ